MREIVLDTETTGLSPDDGHRIVEIGCVELQSRIPTGRTYQQYIRPDRPMLPDAARISGLTDEFLKDFPSFHDIAGDFLAFIEDSPLVIHNASFDMKFIHAELKRLGHPLPLPNPIIDTLHIARQKYPGSPASLDALCRRFSIDTSHRTLHGALLDSHLLVRVYAELLGHHRRSLFEDPLSDISSGKRDTATIFPPVIFPLRTFSLSSEDKARHQAFVLSRIKNALWDHV